MTFDKSIAEEIETAVEQSIEDEKGFEDAEEKKEGGAAAVVEDKEADPEAKAKESHKDDDKGATEEVQDDESGGSSGEDEGGKEGEPETAQTTPGPTETPVISEGALELAIRSGFTVAEANSFGNENTLLKAVQIINEKGTPAAEESKEEKANLLGDLPKLDPEQYEPEVIASFDKMRDAIQEQQKVIEQLKQETQVSQANQSAQAERELVAWFDGKVAGLGKQHTKTLGEGSHGSLNQGSSQYAKREEIVDHINLLSAGYASTGREAPPLDTLFDQAAKFVLQDEIGSIKEKKLSDRLSKRAGQHLARPNSEKVGTLETAEASEKELVSKIDKQFFKDR